MITLKHCSMKEADEVINKAGVELMDALEGVLLDSLIGSNAAGEIFLFRACFVNSNSSDYTIKKSQSEEERAELWREWETITAHT